VPVEKLFQFLLLLEFSLALEFIFVLAVTH